ncbi:RIOK3 isoform 10, partial [Pan troglodytes]
IDVSQSVEPTHPHGLEFLFRDCRNVSQFFQKGGVKEALSERELFNAVSGLNITADNEADFLAEVTATPCKDDGDARISANSCLTMGLSC